MSAVIDDPTAPVIYHQASGQQQQQQQPFASPPNPALPATVLPKQVTLRDRITAATLVPFCSASEVPRTLLAYLCNQLNKEIEKGDTYPMTDPFSLDLFASHWFSHFGAVMLLGAVNSVRDVMALEREGADWGKVCLGSFNIKPNYPGRSSHICNGAFLVTDASRNRGVGRLMGECYLEWAPRLGYTYSVFNLVYETNVASCRIWDALGFKRIGRVPGCGNLRSYPGQLVDAIIYGRDLGSEGEDFVSEERFDKIRYYLKHSKYPSGADRAEKSRLRSAATHYKLVGGENGEPEKLMLKDKEVVSDPQQQYEIARQVHLQQHGGINKTTANIALKYHWVRIKETVSMVIKNCPQCKEAPKPSPIAPDSSQSRKKETGTGTPREQQQRTFDISPEPPEQQLANVHQYAKEDAFAPPTHPPPPPMMHEMVEQMPDYSDIPLDPQIMDDIQQHLPAFQHHPTLNPYEMDGLHEPHPLQHEFDHTQIPPHHDPHHHQHPNEFQCVPKDAKQTMASQAAAALREQTMRLVDANRLHSEGPLHRDMLTAFGGREEPPHYG